MQNNRKKRVLIVTDNTLAMTGFGSAAKLYIEYLYKTNKYEIIHACIGSVNSPDMERFPWTSIGVVDPNQIQQLKQQNKPETHEMIDRQAGYGAFKLDEIVNKYKPDSILMVQDIWAFDMHVDKSWFKAINPIIWTTLDSLPILPRALEIAPKVKNYWIWADFATKAMHKLGHNHVKTVRGPVDTKNFYKLSEPLKNDLRLKNGIDENTFIVGFVFRNQLRKSVPQLLEGFSLFQKDVSNSKLLLHTHWTEGWNIQSLMLEYKINPKDILTTYICKNCKNYEVKPFTGHDLDCKYCKAQKSQITTSPAFGVSGKQLNEIYNLMDVYVHPFTSGGQEIPIQESKLTELITLVTNYSCGEDACIPEDGTLPLDYAEYREPGTQFIKATTYPSSISKNLNKVYNMSKKERYELGKKSRQWILDNYTVQRIGKTIETAIDEAKLSTDDDFAIKNDLKDPNYTMPYIEDNEAWIIHLYHNILKMTDVDKNNDGFKYWVQKIKEGASRSEIENYFRKTAHEENQKKNTNTQVSFEHFLNKDDKGRVLFCVKESAGDVLLCTSLFKSIKKRYPDWALYVATKSDYRDIIIGNEYVDKWLEWNPILENHLWAIGNSQNNGYFNICYLPTVGTQDKIDYVNSGEDSIDFNIMEELISIS